MATRCQGITNLADTSEESIFNLTDHPRPSVPGQYWRRKAKLALVPFDGHRQDVDGLMPLNLWSLDWRNSRQEIFGFTYASDGWGQGRLILPPSDSSCTNIPDFKAYGQIMWDELTNTVEECCVRCMQRFGCVGYNWHKSTECVLMASLHSRQQYAGVVTGSVNNLQKMPLDCLTIGMPCSCPPSTWAEKVVTRSDACNIIMNKTIVFSGDSIIRDVWTTLAVWLLVLDGIDAQFMAGYHHHAVCMIQAWKFLDFVGFTKLVQRMGVFDGGRFVVCGGSTTLIFDPHWKGDFFSTPGDSLSSHASFLKTRYKADFWILGGFLAQMSKVKNRISVVKQFVTKLHHSVEAAQISTFFLGMHARIIPLTPAVYLDDAMGIQGNKQIQLWNSVLGEKERSFSFVDTYNITLKLQLSYDDSEDGAHQGFWVNLQKVQKLLVLMAAT